jgi:hypothetical protein
VVPLGHWRFRHQDSSRNLRCDGGERSVVAFFLVVVWNSEVCAGAGTLGLETREFRDYNGHVIERV